jgi:hypothetical protein
MNTGFSTGARRFTSLLPFPFLFPDVAALNFLAGEEEDAGEPNPTPEELEFFERDGSSVVSDSIWEF